MCVVVAIKFTNKYRKINFLLKYCLGEGTSPGITMLSTETNFTRASHFPINEYAVTTCIWLSTILWYSDVPVFRFPCICEWYIGFNKTGTLDRARGSLWCYTYTFFCLNCKPDFSTTAKCFGISLELWKDSQFYLCLKPVTGSRWGFSSHQWNEKKLTDFF